MIYLNLKTATLRSPEYIGSEPTARATWLSILCYCCEQENGGIIPACVGWKDRQWQQTCGVTFSEVREQSLLWEWHGDDLAVAFYPADKQAEIQAKREAGRRGGKRSGEARREPESKPVCEAQLEAVLEAELEGELQRKGKEGKGIGMERKLVKRVAEVSATNDTEWLAELAKNPAYTSLDVQSELGKMQAWCEANGKQGSRRRFINWLNRAEKPLKASGTAFSSSRRPASAWEIKQALEAVKAQISRIKGNPDNTTAKDAATPWERQLKPEAAAQHKALKEREQELVTQLAMLGKEPQPRLRL